MALHPPPTISAGLVLVHQPLTHSAMSHTCLVTYAVDNDTALTAQQCADGVQTAFNNAFKNDIDANATIQKPTILLGDGTDTPAMAIGSGATQVGLSALNLPPPNVSILIKRTTALSGKKNRGRMYLPFILDRTGTTEGGQILAFNLGIYQTDAT